MKPFPGPWECYCFPHATLRVAFSTGPRQQHWHRCWSETCSFLDEKLKIPFDSQLSLGSSSRRTLSQLWNRNQLWRKPGEHDSGLQGGSALLLTRRSQKNSILANSRNVPQEGNSLQDKPVMRCNHMQAGELTLPGRLRALPQRERHSITARPCSGRRHKSSHSGYGQQRWEPGLCPMGHLRTQHGVEPARNGSSRDVARPNSQEMNPPVPAVAQHGRLLHDAPGSQREEVSEHEEPAQTRTGVQGERDSLSPHPRVRATGVPASQTARSIRRASATPQRAVTNETAIQGIQ